MTIKETALERHRLLMIAYHFPPDGEVGARRTVRFAKYLPFSGWDPVVLTVAERHYELLDPAAAIPDVPIHRTELVPGLREIACRLRKLIGHSDDTCSQCGTTPAESSELEYVPPERISFLLRVFYSLMWLPDDRQGWILPAVWTARRLSLKYPFDMIYSTGPPWSNQVIGMLVAMLLKKPWIADFRDPWMGGRLKPFFVRSELSDRVDAFLERQVLRRATRIICLCEQQRQSMLSQHPYLPPQKVVVIPNGFDPDEMPRDRKRSGETSGPMTITYAGKLYCARDPENLFAVISKLIQLGTISKEEIRLRFIGKCDHVRGVPLTGIAGRYGLSEIVETPGQMPRDRCLDELRKSDILLLLAMDQKAQVPAKLFEYLMMEKPVLAFTEDDSATAEVIQHTRGGTLVDITDSSQTAAALVTMIQEWRKGRLNGKLDRHALAGYSGDLLAGELAAVMMEVIDRSKEHVHARSCT